MKMRRLIVNFFFFITNFFFNIKKGVIFFDENGIFKFNRSSFCLKKKHFFAKLRLSTIDKIMHLPDNLGFFYFG